MVKNTVDTRPDLSRGDRVSSIDTLKGIAIFMVILIHTRPFFALEEVSGNYHLLGNLVVQLASFGVPFFFVTAGYFFSLSSAQRGLYPVWKRYISRLFLIAILWTLIDGIFWTDWLQQLIDTKSIAPLLWNLLAIPSFAAKRPELFFLRGTATPLWFLISLIAGITITAIALWLKFDKRFIFILFASLYLFSLVFSSYSISPGITGGTLPISSRGPFIAPLFLFIGYLMTSTKSDFNSSRLLLIISIILLLSEPVLLAQLLDRPLREHQFLLTTPLLAYAALAFALSYRSLGRDSIIAKVGTYSLGIYLVHVPLLEAFKLVRNLFFHPAWEITFPLLMLTTSFCISLCMASNRFTRRLIQ